MELKICRRCGKEKTIDNYRKSGKKADGSIYYRATCKVCDLELEYKRKEEKGIIPKTPKKMPKPIEKKSKECICEFSKNEIISLKQLLRENTITNHKIPESTITNHKFDKKDRIKATYNIEKSIKIKLDEYCKKSLQNNSDVVNIALSNFLDNKM